MNEIILEDMEQICSGNLEWEKFRDRTVLIAGAYGMLPSYMVFTLMYLNEIRPELNIRVVAMCRNIDKARGRFGDFLDHQLFSINCADICGEISVEGPVDYIIHAASPASSQFYGVDPVGVISPNVFGTRNLLELAREKKSTGFLFFSSGEVCGAVDKEWISEEDSGYLDPTDLRSCYGESKRMAENMCKCWNVQYNVPTFIVRPEHTYGPTMNLKNDCRVFSEFVSDIVNNRDIVIKSDGSPVRTFCYISDATEGFFRVLLQGVPGESYNVGNEQGRISIGDLADLLVGLFPEKGLKAVYEKRKKDNSYLEQSASIRPRMSIAKIQAIGYLCRYNLKEGFTRTIRSVTERES